MMFAGLRQSAPSLIELQTFGFATYRKRNGLYSFKLTKNSKYKNNHAMSNRKRLDLKKMGYEGELRIKDTERASSRPFGELDTRSRFKFRIEKVPFYNIPDLTGFTVSDTITTFANLSFRLVAALCESYDAQDRL